MSLLQNKSSIRSSQNDLFDSGTLTTQTKSEEMRCRKMSQKITYFIPKHVAQTPTQLALHVDVDAKLVCFGGKSSNVFPENPILTDLALKRGEVLLSAPSSIEGVPVRIVKITHKPMNIKKALS
jgi:hypothetical protein